MPKSTPSKGGRKAAAGKPDKPYDGFPLFPHATKRWAKKIRGRFHYFGPWDDPDGALKRYLEQRDDLHAGRTPRATGDGLTLRDLCNRFVTEKEDLADAGEIHRRTFNDYYKVCEYLVEFFGKNRLVDDLAADDFTRLRRELAKRLGPVALGNTIQRVRTIFKYAVDMGLVDKAVRFGPGFRKPAKRVMRKARAENGVKMLEPKQLRKVIDAAPIPLKAMMLLALNCGFGNSDVGNLPRKALDLKGGWVRFPRPKTGIERRCPLWPETIESLKAALKERPKPTVPEAKGLVFVTATGLPWAKETSTNPVAKRTISLLKRLKLHRPKFGFYVFRHIFRTVADGSRDQPAIDYIMGHARDDMASLYREGIDDERLQAVTDHVHRWLWPVDKTKQ